MGRHEVETTTYGGGAESVARAVHAIDPNARGAVDLGTARVTVPGSGGSSDGFARAIAAAGFPAEPV